MRRFIVVISLPALLAAALPAPNVEFARRIVDTHNDERARVGTQPLRWSDSLASDAQRWADHMASTGEFEHAAQKDHGENLWMGTRASYRYEEMVGSWVDERAMYKPGRFPDVTTTSDWKDVGHYTQLIWHSTTHVGCAMASNKQDDYLVCRYGPPGNWEGQNPVSPGQ